MTVWNPPPTSIKLSKDHVHVWQASIDQPAPLIQQLAVTLSPDELMRARYFNFERDRKRFITARGLLRTLLGYYLNIEPSRIQFLYGANGKPSLAEKYCGFSLHFNLSHSEGLALYAIAFDREVGVDLEYIRPIPEVDQLAERLFSHREKEVFRLLPPPLLNVNHFHRRVASRKNLTQKRAVHHETSYHTPLAA